MTPRLPVDHLSRAGTTRFPPYNREGMTLTEVMIVIVIGLVLLGVLAPSLSGFLLLDQHRAAKELSLLYEQLHDEAVMRNVTFRLEFDLEAGTYQVQAAESGALIFDNPRAREEWNEAEERRTRQMSDEEKAKHERKRASFAKLEARFKTDFQLPNGSVFEGFYTPQYEEMVRRGDLPEDSPKVYSYIFPNGQSEHTVIWVTTEGEPDDGYTIEVEPLSGGVKLHGQLIEWDESYDFVPDEAPDLPGI